MKKSYLLITFLTAAFSLPAFSQTVGVGITNGAVAFEPNSRLHVDGSFAAPIRRVGNGQHLLTEADFTIIAESTLANPSVILLPDPTGIKGRVYNIVSVLGLLAAVNIQVNGGVALISGAASLALTVNYNNVTIQSDGTNWIVIGSGGLLGL